MFRNSLFKFLLIILLNKFLISSAFSQNSNLIPRHILFGNPDKISVRLSPNGQYISYVAPKDGVLNVWVANANDLASAKPITDDKGRGVRDYHWAYDNHTILYLQDEKGDENFRIYSYDLKTKHKTLLTAQAGVKAFVYKLSPTYPNEVIIGLNERNPAYFDPYKVNLKTGNKELLLQNDKYSHFIFDSNLAIRFGVYSNDSGGSEYYQYKNNQFSLYLKIDLDDDINSGLLSFDSSDKCIYFFDSRGRDTTALKLINLENDSITTLFADEKADIDIFAAHPTSRKIQAVSINYEKQKIEVLDEDIKDDINYLSKLDIGELNIVSRSLDDSEWIVAYMSDIGPVKYYKFTRGHKSAQYLFSNNQKLENLSLSPMHPVIIKSRDNLNLVSYLTLPPEASSRNSSIIPTQPVPLVVYVHGGPRVRDDWGYSSVHQWLANRGYAVLSVNYRSSTGFGKNFVNAGNLQWGLKMHDDLIDAVNWAITNKIADPKKIAIMGGSYGGYATLVGLTLTPEVFACGIDIVGPSNLITLINSVPPYWTPYLAELKYRMGNFETEEGKQALMDVSPLFHVDKITKPLLIGQGAHDPRVKQAESDQIVAALKAKNIPVIYALYNDEGHGFVRPENKQSFFALAEQFLAKILGGKHESIGDDFNGADFNLNAKEKISPKDAEKLISEAVQ